MTKLVLKKLLLASGLCLTLLTVISPQSVVCQDQPRPDKVRETHTLRGSFVGFKMGDYLHAEIRKPGRKRVSFFVAESESLRYFLAVNRGKSLSLTYQLVDTHIPEAGGVQTIKRLVSAKAGAVSDAGWWKRISKTSNVRSLRTKYDALVERAMIK